MPQAFLGLGSNLGDRDANLRDAIAALSAASGVKVMRVSRFIETAPQGGPAQPAYLNAAAEIDTSLTPRQLLQFLLDIEAGLGRVRKEHWGPRTLDLDLLLYERRIIDEPDLVVPHPQMHAREFVLKPLAEIAPEAYHPVLGKSARRLLEALRASSSLDNPETMPPRL